ncbi:hypothetical protein C2G38_2200773 [Gigaspora rosea]|uniref:Uncharacterized protein n=1 Tax=Gigaspora rosea TaxID=44941 RepID=A0A397UYV8_9GLOM|nr:hypothetical protein C2G38_2200773 [Gigaspora rosea]
MFEPTNKDLVSEQNGFIEDQYDTRNITLQAMIDEIGSDNIKEIWKVIDLHKSIINQFSSDDIVEDEDTCELKNKYIFDESVTSVSKPASSFANIQNSPKVVGRGKPKKQRYISSVEKEQKHRRSLT